MLTGVNTSVPWDCLPSGFVLGTRLSASSEAKGHPPSHVPQLRCGVAGAARMKVPSRSSGFPNPSLFPLLFNIRLPTIAMGPAGQQKTQCSSSFPCLPAPPSLSQMLCLSLFLPVYSSSKRHLSTEMHKELCYMCEKLFWQKCLPTEMCIVTWPPNSPKLWSTEMLSCQDILVKIYRSPLKHIYSIDYPAAIRTDKCEKEKAIKITVYRKTLTRDNTIEKSRMSNCSRMLITTLPKVWLHMDVALEIMK